MSNFLAHAQRQLAEDVPLAKATGVQIAFDDAGRITARAPFAPNRNMHDTVFGGSLYVVSVVCGFAQTRWLLEQAGLGNAEVVIHKAEAEYHLPVRGPVTARIDATCATADSAFVRTLERRGRARLALTVAINEHDERGFTLRARYAARISAPSDNDRYHP